MYGTGTVWNDLRISDIPLTDGIISLLYTTIVTYCYMHLRFMNRTDIQVFVTIKKNAATVGTVPVPYPTLYFQPLEF